MGLNATTFAQFIRFREERVLEGIGSVLELGSQEVWCSGEEHWVRDALEDFGAVGVTDDEVRRIAHNGSARMFYERIGWRYACIDTSGEYDAIPLDLNFDRLPERFEGAFDMVTNFGTSEHVANQLNCLKVVHDAVRVGGLMYHEVPCDGYLDHGFFTYNPLFFWMVAKANLYDHVGMWLGVAEEAVKLPDGSSDLIQDLPSDPGRVESFESRRAGLAVLLRRKSDHPFVPPLDGDLSGVGEKLRKRYESRPIEDKPQHRGPIATLRERFLSRVRGV